MFLKIAIFEKNIITFLKNSILKLIIKSVAKIYSFLCEKTFSNKLLILSYSKLFSYKKLLIIKNK